MSADTLDQVRSAIAQLATEAASARAELGAATDALDDALAAERAAAAVEVIDVEVVRKDANAELAAVAAVPRLYAHWQQDERDVRLCVARVELRLHEE